jgi:hypothetical protein
MSVALVYDEGGDWVGVYIDGKLKYESHSITEDQLLDCCGVAYQVRWTNLRALNASRLPADLSAVVESEELEKQRILAEAQVLEDKAKELRQSVA